MEDSRLSFLAPIYQHRYVLAKFFNHSNWGLRIAV